MPSCGQTFQRGFFLTGIQREQQLSLPDGLALPGADLAQHAPLQAHGGLLLSVLHHALRQRGLRPVSPLDRGGLHRDFGRIGQKKKRRHRCQSHGDNAQGSLGSGHGGPSQRQFATTIVAESGRTTHAKRRGKGGGFPPYSLSKNPKLAAVARKQRYAGLREKCCGTRVRGSAPITPAGGSASCTSTFLAL